ncbi:MAG: alpha/beta hydrolase [Streptosporangiaceae bacterium]|jgi:pimeloyl-ACP methyl ester carboxylesterase
MSRPAAIGYVPVNGLDMYWESRGDGGVPLVVVHGGFGLASMFGDLLDQLAEKRQVIAVELQAHGHTRDTGRPFSFEAFGDDIAGVIEHLRLGQADLLGYPWAAAQACAAWSSTPAGYGGWRWCPRPVAATAGSPRSSPGWRRSAGMRSVRCGSPRCTRRGHRSLPTAMHSPP